MNFVARAHLAKPVWRFAGVTAALAVVLLNQVSAATVDDRVGAACPMGVVATVSPSFMDDESAPAFGRHLWAYKVTVVNGSKTPVRLIGRAWVATDASGVEHRFGGAGLVGKQPDLSAGARFSYTSWMALPTAKGAMTGVLLAELPGGTGCTVDAGVTKLRMPGYDD